MWLVVLVLLTWPYFSVGVQDPLAPASAAPPKDDTAWSFNMDGVMNVFTKTTAQVNSHLETLAQKTKAYTKLGDEALTKFADQAELGLKNSKTFLQTRALMAVVRTRLSKIPPDNRFQGVMVNAFMEVMNVELRKFIPREVDLPDLEMATTFQYICGASGKIMDLKAMTFLPDSTTSVDAPFEQKTLDVTVRYNYQNLHMKYDRLGESTTLTSPVTGTLDLEFTGNEVEFQLEIINVNDFNNPELNPACMLSIKGFEVIKLVSPNANIEPSHPFRLFAEKTVRKFARRHKQEFENLFRLGVLKSLHNILKPENEWICKTKQLEDLLKINEEKVLKPTNMEEFAKCKMVSEAKQEKREETEKKQPGKKETDNKEATDTERSDSEEKH